MRLVSEIIKEIEEISKITVRQKIRIKRLAEFVKNAHTRECMEYAAKTGHGFCISSCRDLRVELIGSHCDRDPGPTSGCCGGFDEQCDCECMICSPPEI